MKATAASELDQATSEAPETCPEASVIVAEAWTVEPDAIGSVAIVIESEGVDCPPGSVEPDPPHANRVSATALRAAL
jgi:hypothetical protein